MGCAIGISIQNAFKGLCRLVVLFGSEVKIEQASQCPAQIALAVEVVVERGKKLKNIEIVLVSVIDLFDQSDKFGPFFFAAIHLVFNSFDNRQGLCRFPGPEQSADELL